MGSMTLDRLVEQVRAAHGDALLAVVLYGSTARRPEAARGHDVLVVVRTLDLQGLRASGAIGRSWGEAGNSVPLVMTEGEWRSSADVFAIEHADIADRHQILYAAPGFAIGARASIRDEDIRRQLEYESLALLLRVRAAAGDAGPDVRAMRAVLAAHGSSALALFRAALRLGGRSVGDDDAVCGAAAEAAGFSAVPFVAAVALRRGTKDVPKDQLASVVDEFHRGLMAFVRHVDRLAAVPGHP
jgi:hypothetical protein